MANSLRIPSRPPASIAPAIMVAMPAAPKAVKRPEAAAAPELPERHEAASAVPASASTARKSWKLAARKLVQRERAAPKPRRRRRGDARDLFRAAASMTIRQAVELVTFARAGAFLSDTLDWLNLWDNANHTNDDLHYSENAHLSLRL